MVRTGDGRPGRCRGGLGLAPALAALAIAVGSAPAAAQGPGPQKPEAPKWLDDEGKDLFNDLEGDDQFYGDGACETREKLLKKMAGKGDKDAADHRARVLLGLGLCEFRKGDYALSKRRLDSCVSEMNLPSEEFMLQNQGIAHIALIKQAATFMSKHEITQAGTALRRCREIIDRNLRKILKMVHKQMGQGGQAPPLDIILEELPGYGKTGQYLPMILKQVPMLKQEFPFAELVDNAVFALDNRVAAIDTSLKAKRLRLDVSKGKSKEGSLLYVRVLPAEAIVPAERLAAAQELVSGGVADALVEEAAQIEKGQTLIKRAKEGSGCKEGKGLTKTCKALQAVADISSNAFGESRLLIVKAGKKQSLDSCTTNANVGILLATKEGATVTVAGVAEPVALAPKQPVVVDFCREASIHASATVPVLFAQAWHPEFAALERTTELRARSKTFGLSEDDLKAATKVVNDHAKKSWDKNAALWRKDSEGHNAIRQAFEDDVKNKKQKEEDAAEAKRMGELAGDEERERALEELAKKRDAKRKREAEVEQARLRREKLREEERAKRDPWLNKPAVLEAEKKIKELQEARRDANAKLEFDLSNQLTRDISAAERALKKVIKQERKAWKKGGGSSAGAAAGAKDEPEDSEEQASADKASGESAELQELRAKLRDVSTQKAAAAEAENFKEAKRLKKEQQELEERIKKLEL